MQGALAKGDTMTLAVTAAVLIFIFGLIGYLIVDSEKTDDEQ